MRILATSVLMIMLALAASAVAPSARAGTAAAPTRAEGGAGSTIAVAGWQIQASDKAQESGTEISSAAFSAP